MRGCHRNVTLRCESRPTANQLAGRHCGVIFDAQHDQRLIVEVLGAVLNS